MKYLKSCKVECKNNRNKKKSKMLIFPFFPIIMFVSYLLAGMIPIIPIVIFDQPLAKFLSIIFAFVGLFVIGYIKGKIVQHKPLRSATELLVIGGIATLIGLIVGQILKV